MDSMKRFNRNNFFSGLRWSALLSAVLVLVGCGSVEVTEPVAVTPQGGVRVAFDSFVNVGYERDRSLPGLAITRDAIAVTLGLWYEQIVVRQSVIDGTPADLEGFLRDLPGPEQCDISVVYLGSIQTDTGGWEFVNGDIVYWRDVLASSLSTAHPCRIVILDACHAAAVRDIPVWSQQFATVTLLASDRDEKTYQFEPVRLMPVDLQKHYPAGWSWAQTYLQPHWRRHISFLGVMWAETAAHAAQPPADAAGWTTFFDACSQNATLFHQSKSPRWGSTMQTFPK